MKDDDLTTGLLWSPVFTCMQLRHTVTEIDWLPVRRVYIPLISTGLPQVTSHPSVGNHLVDPQVLANTDITAGRLQDSYLYLRKQVISQVMYSDTVYPLGRL